MIYTVEILINVDKLKGERYDQILENFFVRGIYFWMVKRA